MQYIDQKQVATALRYEELVESLRDIYRAEGIEGMRQLINLDGLKGAAGTCMALMPAWGPGHDLTTKIFTLFPDNLASGLPTIHAVILVFDSKNGLPKAVIDGTEVTRRRTAAMCALAADYLARQDCKRLVVCGAGALAPHAALAHAAVRPISHVDIWARRPEAAQEVVEYLQAQRDDLDFNVVTDLQSACERADIVSCQTSAADPVVFGDWIKPGTHMDFVGSHDPDRRECDDEAVRKSRVYVDVMETAMREAGDILIPLSKGVIDKTHILGDLSTLSRNETPGRANEQEITLFKSTGSALADMAAAELALKNSHPAN